MRKIESYTELSALIMKQFRRGMVTNSFFAKEEYETEIANGTLDFHECENALLIFRQRREHTILNFWINDGFSFDEMKFPPNTVLEIVHRERDTGLKEAVEKWKNAGFSPEFRRQRMVCGEIFDIPAEINVRRAESEDFNTVKTLLRENFSALTGCLPTDEALAKDIENGCVLLYDMNINKLGLLHYTKDKKKTELRHLCVAESSRGQGIGEKLVREYNRLTNGMTRHVWVRADNSPAVKLYEKYGYCADGMTSDVLINR